MSLTVTIFDDFCQSDAFQMDQIVIVLFCIHNNVIYDKIPNTSD